MISPRTTAEIKDLSSKIESALGKNDRNLLLDAFEASELGKEVYMSSHVNNYSEGMDLTVTVKTGSQAEEVINWWKDAISGIRVSAYHDYGTDGTNPFRCYTMNMRDRDDNRRMDINTYFAQGTCEFVEEPTGETEEVPERPAEEAYTKVVTKRVLRCDDQVIPTGLPEPAPAIAE